MTVLRKIVLIAVFGLGFMASGETPALADEPLICKKLAKIYPHKLNFLPKSARKLSKEQQCRLVYWWAIKVKPLTEVLTPGEHKSFQQALTDKNCEVAVSILRPRFVEAHPDAPSIIENDSDFELWKQTTVASRYPRLGLCFELKKISEARAEIDKRGLNPAPFGRFTDTDGYMRGIVPKDPVRKRDSAVYAILVVQLRLGHPDLSLALLSLSVEGKELKFHPDQELFLALFLRESGVVKPVVNQVIARPIDNKKREALEALAKKKDVLDAPLFTPFQM